MSKYMRIFVSIMFGLVGLIMISNAQIADLTVDNPQIDKYEIIGDTLHLFVDGYWAERVCLDYDEYWTISAKKQIKPNYIIFNDSLAYTAGARRVLSRNEPLLKINYEDLDNYRVDRNNGSISSDSLREILETYYGNWYSQLDGTPELQRMYDAYYEFKIPVKYNYLYMIRIAIENTEEVDLSTGVIIAVGDLSSTQPGSGSVANQQAIRIRTAYNDISKVTVAPNPYKVNSDGYGASWCTDNYMQMLSFNFLPKKCTLKIFTVAGDLIKTVHLDADKESVDFDNLSRMNSVFGFMDIKDNTLGNPPTQEYNYQNTVVNTATYFWDLTTDEGLDVAPGVYIYLVQDDTNGAQTSGKFVIIK